MQSPFNTEIKYTHIPSEDDLGGPHEVRCFSGQLRIEFKNDSVRMKGIGIDYTLPRACVGRFEAFLSSSD